MREKVGKSRNTMFFQWFVAPDGRKVGSLKRRVRSQLARWEMKNCTPLWREARFEVKMYKTHHSRTTFGSWDVEKVSAFAARSTFRSENVQSTPHSDHFWKFRCGKSARRCGAKHISKWTCTKHTTCSCHFWKFRCEKSARCCGAKHMSKWKCTKHTTCSRHFWKFQCGKSARCCGAKHMSKWTCTKHHMFAALLEVQMSLRFTSLQYTAVHYTPLHYITLHYTPLHYNYNYTTTLHYTPLHYTTLHNIITLPALPSTSLHYITLHSTTLHSTTLQLHLQLHNYTPRH